MQLSLFADISHEHVTLHYDRPYGLSAALDPHTRVHTWFVGHFHGHFYSSTIVELHRNDSPREITPHPLLRSLSVCDAFAGDTLEKGSGGISKAISQQQYHPSDNGYDAPVFQKLSEPIFALRSAQSLVEVASPGHPLTLARAVVIFRSRMTACLVGFLIVRNGPDSVIDDQAHFQDDITIHRSGENRSAVATGLTNLPAPTPHSPARAGGPWPPVHARP